MTICANIKDQSVQCCCQPQDGVMCPYGPQPPLEHILSADCWCEPEIAYKDPETGVQVIVHRKAGEH